MDPFADEALAIVVPIVVYWLCSGMYMALGHSMDMYRMHSKEEERRNDSEERTEGPRPLRASRRQHGHQRFANSA
ncbi:hypothetical protein E2562_000260 [Oryza meyeriana var. granulata]|uniref:Uncharacterized protein n=1 Tax=Oryza meyeriana var. granulata TaxID=110450 RepID=A0A6G1CMK7_9ORYZ|nr:hypothetical protein E2562_000260 [Oryza meyeriana var. granulata]